MMKLNDDLIIYITEDLNEPVAFILNCKNNTILKIDNIGIELIKKILNSKPEEDISEYISMFEGCDLFEKRDA